MGQYPQGEYDDVTEEYSGMLGQYGFRDMEGVPWQGEVGPQGQPLYFKPHTPAVEAPTVIKQLAEAKKEAAAAVASSEIRTLPGGNAGVPRTLIIDGSALFGNSALLGVALAVNVDTIVNTYTVQTGYQVIMDPEDPMQTAMLRPNTVAALFIQCVVKVDVAEASTGDGSTVFLQESIVFDPAGNFSAGDKFMHRWSRKWVAEAGDLIRTFVRSPVGAAAALIDVPLSRIGHRLRVWKVV